MTTIKTTAAAARLQFCWLLLLLLTPCTIAFQQRNRQDYPNPEISQQECRTTSNRLCDPDGILIDVERTKVLDRIAEIEAKQKISCGSGTTAQEVQIAIALNGRVSFWTK